MFKMKPKRWHLTLMLKYGHVIEVTADNFSFTRAPEGHISKWSVDGVKGMTFGFNPMDIVGYEARPIYF
jgi:hypothetical protein